jgi:hypothetical protein
MKSELRLQRYDEKKLHGPFCNFWKVARVNLELFLNFWGSVQKFVVRSLILNKYKGHFCKMAWNNQF